MLTLLTLLACEPTPVLVPSATDGAPGLSDDDDDDDAPDTGLPTPDEADAVAALQQLPVLFIHGVNGDASNWDVARADLEANGWDPDLLFAETFDDPEWGCNEDNAATIDRWVDAILRETGAEQLHLVAHSMGTLSSRHYLKNLADPGKVYNYVTVGGMHHGLSSSCSPDFPFKPCIWDEICTSGAFVTALDVAPLTPNAVHYVSIYSTGDDTVPTWSSQLNGAFLIELDGLEHDGPDGVQERPESLTEVRRALLWP